MHTKLTFVKSASPAASSRATMVFIPGGPCFSSETLKELEALKDSFHLVFLDPPGTGGTSDLEKITYETLCEDIEAALLSLNRPVILVGHSYGGIQSAEIAVRGRVDVRGLCCIATPFTVKSFDVMQKQYLTHRNEEMIAAEEVFEKEKNAENFLRMNISYRVFYFNKRCEAAGVEMFKRDRFSYRAYLGVNADKKSHDYLLDGLRKLSLPKFAVMGGADLMFPKDVLWQEALQGGFQCAEVVGAGHFVSFDEPEKTCELIREFFLE